MRGKKKKCFTTITWQASRGRNSKSNCNKKGSVKSINEVVKPKHIRILTKYKAKYNLLKKKSSRTFHNIRITIEIKRSFDMSISSFMTTMLLNFKLSRYFKLILIKLSKNLSHASQSNLLSYFVLGLCISKKFQSPILFQSPCCKKNFFSAL